MDDLGFIAIGLCRIDYTAVLNAAYFCIWCTIIEQ